MTSKDSFPCMCGLFNRNTEFNQLFGGSASGSMPRMNPPTATGGNPRPSQQAFKNNQSTSTSQGDALERRGSPQQANRHAACPP